MKSFFELYEAVQNQVPVQNQMQPCKTCKWWKQGECDFVNTIHASNPETRFEIEATAADDHGLESELRTGPNFGCIHHS